MIVTDLLWNYVACILLASFGGLARVLNLASSTRITRKVVIKEIVSSTFAGIVVLLVCVEYKLTPTMIGAVSGCIGYFGVRTFDTYLPALFKGYVKKKIGVELEAETGAEADKAKAKPKPKTKANDKDE